MKYYFNAHGDIIHRVYYGTIRWNQDTKQVPNWFICDLIQEVSLNKFKISEEQTHPVGETQQF